MTPVCKGQGAKTFKKWLDDLKESLKEKKLKKSEFPYAGGPEFANQMKEKLLKKPIPVLETGSIIKLTLEKMHGPF